jgi:hypothetical protein
MTPKQRARTIEKAMKITIASLESHLAWTYGTKKAAFHKKAIAEYCTLLVLLSTLY